MTQNTKKISKLNDVRFQELGRVVYRGKADDFEQGLNDLVQLSEQIKLYDRMMEMGQMFIEVHNVNSPALGQKVQRVRAEAVNMARSLKVRGWDGDLVSDWVEENDKSRNN